MNHYIKTEVNKIVKRYKTRDVYELIDKLDIITVDHVDEVLKKAIIGVDTIV